MLVNRGKDGRRSGSSYNGLQLPWLVESKFIFTRGRQIFNDRFSR